MTASINYFLDLSKSFRLKDIVFQVYSFCRFIFQAIRKHLSAESWMERTEGQIMTINVSICFKRRDISVKIPVETRARTAENWCHTDPKWFLHHLESEWHIRHVGEPEETRDMKNNNVKFSVGVNNIPKR